MKKALLLTAAACLPASTLAAQTAAEAPALSYGERPFYLIDRMEEGALKQKLMSCMGQEPQRSEFSIGHRGAPLMFPEHTDVSNRAAARQGAGILECDVAFTEDKELVCRHAQNDLHTTTNILTTDLAGACTTGFTPAGEGAEAAAECRTSDITLAEFETLAPKMDSFDPAATTPEEYQGGVEPWRTTLYANGAELLTHAESIELFRALGAKFTPELKAPTVEMPFDGFTQEDYAQKLIDEYKAAGIAPEDVWPQSFRIEDVRYWIENEPEYGAQAVYLDDQDTGNESFDNMDPATWEYSMQELADMGIRYLAPPLWMMVALNEAGEIVPSAYAEEAKAAGLNLIAWSLERSGPLADGGGWYFQSIEEAVDGDADYYNLLHVLAQDVGVVGVFSDWPATVTYYANCFGL